MKEEGLKKTDNNKIFIGKQMTIDTEKFTADLKEMRAICDTNDKEAVIEKLKVLVPTFHHDTAYLELMKNKELQYRKEYSEAHDGEEDIVVVEEDGITAEKDKEQALEIIADAEESTATVQSAEEKETEKPQEKEEKKVRKPAAKKPSEKKQTGKAAATKKSAAKSKKTE